MFKLYDISFNPEVYADWLAGIPEQDRHQYEGVCSIEELAEGMKQVILQGNSDPRKAIHIATPPGFTITERRQPFYGKKRELAAS